MFTIYQALISVPMPIALSEKYITFNNYEDRGPKSAGAKGGVPKIYGFVHPLHPC